MDKKAARELYKQKRKELSQEERVNADDLMLIQFQKMDFPHIHYLLSYWPIEENNEPNTHLFKDELSFRNPSLKLLYPKSDFENIEMEAIEVNVDTAFEKNARNIHEPMDGTVTEPVLLDMIFVPLLIFDKKGYRVGYGQGFYDKFLRRCRQDCLKLGFCYFEPVATIEGTREFDVPLNFCITPNSIYVF